MGTVFTAQKLLAVLLVVAAAGSITIRNFQHEAEQDRLLKEYFALLETFTFEQGLLSEPLDSGVVLLARSCTVTTLRELDGSRRKQLIAFLRASDLITIEVTDGGSGNVQEPVISFKDQDLRAMDLRDVNLESLNFRSTNLSEANLQGANLSEANLQDAILFESNLRGSDLTESNLKDAFLTGADLQDVFLTRANLQGASLNGTYLQNADLSRANLDETYLGYADLSGAKGLTPEQLSSAQLCQTVLPPELGIDGDRDCATP